jgi:hypothetical protein
MPHHAKSFFRTGRGWYVQFGKQQIKLADGPKKADTEAGVWTRYHAVMTERATTKVTPKTPRRPAGRRTPR